MTPPDDRPRDQPGDRAARLVLGFDLAATFVFALEGATSAVVADLDLLGVLVLGLVTAVGGGIIRDVLIGDIPRHRCATSATSESPCSGA